eukprot:8920438-Pyramimonas_sp.AAC.1
MKSALASAEAARVQLVETFEREKRELAAIIDSLVGEVQVDPSRHWRPARVYASPPHATGRGMAPGLLGAFPHSSGLFRPRAESAYQLELCSCSSRIPEVRSRNAVSPIYRRVVTYRLPRVWFQTRPVVRLVI